DADVLVLQVSGSKNWTVKPGPATGDWRPGKTSEDPGPSVLETLLSTGQVLYIPRGYAHAAVGHAGSMSAHLSLTIREAGTEHLVRALAQLLLKQQGLPPRPVDDASLLDVAGALLDGARTRLADLEPQDVLDAARLLQRRGESRHHDQDATRLLDLVTSV